MIFLIIKRYWVQLTCITAMSMLIGLAVHEIVVHTENRVNLAWEKRDAETQRKTEELFKLKQHEADQINQFNRERANNAIKIYAEHYDALRAYADDLPKRMLISTKTTNCSANAMPRSGANGSEVEARPGGNAKAELQESNLRELNQVISRIEEMQLKCERLLNSVS